MKKKGTGLLAVLLTLVLLLTGCQSIAEGLMSGVAGALSDKLDNMEPYPFYLDGRVQYGMSAAEVQAVLGAPVSSADLTEDEEFSMPVAMLDYDWTIAGKKATLQLMFIGDNLCEGELTIPCEATERAGLVDEVKKLVEEAYGDMTGFTWENMTDDAENEVGYMAQFSLTQGVSGFRGEITAIGGELVVSCIAV